MNVNAIVICILKLPLAVDLEGTYGLLTSLVAQMPGDIYQS